MNAELALVLLAFGVLLVLVILLAITVEIMARVGALAVDADKVARLVDEKLRERMWMAHPAGDDR